MDGVTWLVGQTELESGLTPLFLAYVMLGMVCIDRAAGEGFILGCGASSSEGASGTVEMQSLELREKPGPGVQMRGSWAATCGGRCG